MGVRSYVARWGTGLAVRIPKPIAEQWGVREGSAIEIASRGAQVILTKRSHSLAEMMARVTPENLHSGVATGGPVGNEGW